MQNDQLHDKFLIVIGREYGSGGRRIGRKIADALGVNFYDKTLLKEAASKMGYSPEIFESKDEKRPSLIRSILSFTYGANTANIDGAPMSAEKIYEFQSRVIRDICKRESCVIVGRTADYLMREHPGLVSLFIHAPLQVRADAIISRGETDRLPKAEEIARNNDRNRESYYNYYTNSDSWGNAGNYHLSFDSSKVDDETIVEVIRSIIEKRRKEIKQR